ncbi:MAG: radical SAM protein [bacterium]|nr:radical SAM protein [bacterium]
MTSQSIDCILVGYNDVDFDGFASAQKSVEQRAGGYHEIKTNSLFLKGKRRTYMDVLNHYISQATNKPSHLNVFKAPSLGACYLANFLEQRNFKTELINFFNSGQEKLKTLLSQSPRSVAITTTFYVDNSPIIEIVNFIRKYNSTVKIIIGGPHIYNLFCDLQGISLDYIIKSIGADIYITDSQGENTLARVLEQLSGGGNLNEVPNLLYLAPDRSLKKTEREPEDNNLDDNVINWDGFDKNLTTPITYLRTARSCPYSCSFCNYPTMAGTHVLTSIENMEKELRLLKDLGATDVVFIDDTFNVPLPRFKNLLRMMIRNKFDFKWVSFLRCANVDEEGVDLMAESGCIGSFLGIESGDARILKNMNKAAKPERYRWGIEQLKKHNIESFASLICGFPGETEESVRNTMAFIEETGPTFFNVQLYYHDLRAPIHRKAEEFGIHGSGYSWKHNGMTWQEATQWAGYIFKNIRNSIPLGLYGFSLWGVSYLISQGLTMEQIKSFGDITRDMLVDSIDDIPREYPEKNRQLAELFRDTTLVPAALTA